MNLLTELHKKHLVSTLGHVRIYYYCLKKCIMPLTIITSKELTTHSCYSYALIQAIIEFSVHSGIKTHNSVSRGQEEVQQHDH